jgi:two-component system sensor histidine kinase TctE
MKKTITLRRKLLTWLLLPTLILWCLSTVVTYFVTWWFVNHAYDYALVDSAYDLAGQISNKGGRASLDLSGSALQMFLSDEVDTIYYNVINKDGTVLSGDPDLSIPHIAVNHTTPSVSDSIFRGRQVRVVTLSFLPPGLPHDQTVTIRVAETLNKRHQLARQIITTILLPQLLLMVLPGIIVWIGIGKGLLPLARLSKEIAARSPQDLSPLEESNTLQEVRPIIHEINSLLARLAMTLKVQQRFIADAAHQLRTPLSGLKAQTNLAKRQSDPHNMQRTLRLIDTSADAAIRLINQMLSLAQVESGYGETLDLKPLDLGELLREATGEWVPSALRKDVDLGYEGSDACMVYGDRIRIKTLIDNLIDNAIKYSPPGSTITTGIEENRGSVMLTIEDNGIGIPPEEREAVFRRFYRILGNSVDGSGLGLSIVQEVAALHGAYVAIEDAKGHRGTLVRVVFPRIS